jgi:hypothetical protein
LVLQHLTRYLTSLSLLPFPLSQSFSILTICSLSSLFGKPKIWPTTPPNFGTGHSLFLPPSICISTKASNCSSSSLLNSISSFAFLLRCLGCVRPSEVGNSPSAKARGCTGQGRRCGIPTTRNDTARVPVNRLVVRRERGWRWGGILSLQTILNWDRGL